MSAHSNPPANPLRLVVFIRDHSHFEDMNDFIAFQRSKVKDYEWFHGFVGDPVGSHLVIEFHNLNDALMFKLTHG